MTTTDQEALLRDNSLSSFANSRGLFQQTLNNHQQTMASQHQMALHEIGTAINQAFANTPNSAVPAGDASASVVPPSGAVLATAEEDRGHSVEKCTRQNASRDVLKNFSASRVQNSASAGVGSCSTVPSVMEKCPTQNTSQDVLQSSSTTARQNISDTRVISPDSIMSSDSLTSTPHQRGFDGTEDITNVDARRSPVSSSAASRGTELAALTGEEKSSQDHVGTDADGHVPTSVVGVVRLDSQLWQGFHPVSPGSGTHPADHGGNGASKVAATTVSTVEADSTNVAGQSRGTNVTKNAEVTEESAKGLSSFFLHRNVPSPNIAIVQPSVHPVVPQSSAVDQDHHNNRYSSQPSSGASNTAPECFPQEPGITSCADSKAYSAGTMSVNHQPVVSFVSAASTVFHAACPPNTMQVLSTGNGDDPSPLVSHKSYSKSSFGQATTTTTATTSGTIFAIPPSYTPATNSLIAEFPHGDFPMAGFLSDKLDFAPAQCIKDNITYDEIPVDDTSSVSSITSDIVAVTRTVVPGQQSCVHFTVCQLFMFMKRKTELQRVRRSTNLRASVSFHFQGQR